MARRINASEIVLLQTAPYDGPAIRLTIATLSTDGIPVSVVECWRMDFAKLRGLFDSISFVVGIRLHMTVMSAAFGVPYLGLTYEDKCDDFRESIGNESSTLPVGTSRGARYSSSRKPASPEESNRIWNVGLVSLQNFSNNTAERIASKSQ